VLPLFRELTIELHSHCNRDCFFCCRHSDTSGHRKKPDGTPVRKSMPTEMVEKTLLDAQRMDYRGPVCFHHFSEPFLDDRLLGFARMARELGMRPFEHTNGDVLRKNKELRKEAKSAFEYLVVGIYDLETNEEREREVAWWRKELGNRVRFMHTGKMVVRGHHTEKNLDGYEAARGKRPGLPTYPNGRCIRPPLRLMLHYTGNMVLCCEDMLEEFELGSAFDTPLEELWHSPRHTEVVEHLTTGPRSRYRLCSTCPMPP